MRRDQHPEPFWRAAPVLVSCRSARSRSLHPDRDEAFRLYHELMSRPPEEQPVMPPIPFPPGRWSNCSTHSSNGRRKNKAPRTYVWYKRNIQRFRRFHSGRPHHRRAEALSRHLCDGRLPALGKQHAARFHLRRQAGLQLGAGRGDHRPLAAGPDEETGPRGEGGGAVARRIRRGHRGGEGAVVPRPAGAGLGNRRPAAGTAKDRSRASSTRQATASCSRPSRPRARSITAPSI